MINLETTTLIHLSDLIRLGGVKINEIDYILQDYTFRVHCACIYSDDLLYAKLEVNYGVIGWKDSKVEFNCNCV